MRKTIADLRDALKDITKDWRIRSDPVTWSAAASARSMADLGLGTPTSAYLESTEEVNAAPTSFETHGPKWTGV